MSDIYVRKARKRCIATSGSFFEDGEEVELSPSKAPRITIVSSASRDGALPTRSNNDSTHSAIVDEHRNFEETETQRHESTDYDDFELDFGDDDAPLASTPPTFPVSQGDEVAAAPMVDAQHSQSIASAASPVSEERQLPNANHRRPSFSGTYTVASAQLTASDRTAINWANSYGDLKKAYLRGIAHGDPDSRTYELVTRRSMTDRCRIGGG
ncbi:hypothetical protein BJV82DRAFT_244323 [Fennellomyces sp. T-0311]|nr:hypothetical protein BJV82DRAFT_244323 [Fennellomyces sp. T-0311]